MKTELVRALGAAAAGRGAMGLKSCSAARPQWCRGWSLASRTLPLHFKKLYQSTVAIQENVKVKCTVGKLRFH